MAHASNSHFDHGGGDASDMTAWTAVCLSGCRVCPGWGGVASLVLRWRGNGSVLCARSRGEPSSAHCEQRLSERLTPCPCDPVCACTGMRGHAGRKEKRANDATMSQKTVACLSPTPHAAQRAVPGWLGGLGRVGADLASAGSMRPPPSPARHVSTARLATTQTSREAARHHTSQPRNGTPPPIRIASWRARMPA